MRGGKGRKRRCGEVREGERGKEVRGSEGTDRCCEFCEGR